MATRETPIRAMSVSNTEHGLRKRVYCTSVETHLAGTTVKLVSADGPESVDGPSGRAGMGDMSIHLRFGIGQVPDEQFFVGDFYEVDIINQNGERCRA
jgi:hypothetical protein